MNRIQTFNFRLVCVPCERGFVSAFAAEVTDLPAREQQAANKYVSLTERLTVNLQGKYTDICLKLPIEHLKIYGRPPQTAEDFEFVRRHTRGVVGTPGKI